MRTIQRTLRLPPATNGLFETHCRVTRRDESHTLREILALFYADGIEAAERRLTSGLWDELRPTETAPGRKLSDDDIEEIATGRRPAGARRGRSA